jgi:peptide/histidine transporter 3/4
MPLLGAFLADAYLGRYRAVIIACTLYVLVIN